METVRYHTEGRRQPMLIGKDSAGHKIWGGPYTVYQLLGLLLVPLLVSTRSIWGPDLTPLAAGVTIAGLAALSVWGLGLLDFTRNPFHTARSMAALLGSAVTGPDLRLITIKVTKGQTHSVLLAGANHHPSQTQHPGHTHHPSQTQHPGQTQHLIGESDHTAAVGPELRPPSAAVAMAAPAAANPFLSNQASAPAAQPDLAPMRVRSPLDQFLAAATTRSGNR